MAVNRKIKGTIQGILIFSGILAFMFAWRMLAPILKPHILQLFGDNIIRLWSKPYFSLGDVPITPAFLIKIFVYLIIVILFARLSRKLVHSQLLAHTSLDIGQRFALERGIGYVVFVIGMIIGLQSAGLNLSSLVVLGGAIGLGIGLGFQTVANNFTSGIILLIERPIKVGDRVEIGNLNGDVMHIGPRATWIRTNDNIVVVVPNSEFTENRVINWTSADRQIRFSAPVGVSYGSDPEEVREILLEIAAGHPDVLADPKPDVIFKGFGDSSLDFELRIWTINRVQTPQILKSELYFLIFRAFHERGIEIPFPQRDLHIKSSDVPFGLQTAHNEKNERNME